jgi:hypothetical protein
MVASVIAFGFALVVFSLAGEAQTSWLKVAGFVVAAFLTLSGAISGWQHYQR